ncbi:MAG: glycosyltransferase family 4 protein [Gemmatimonadales bacterium]|nr:glycosyltransferase family 4 protein [Gemmatimonadales bacterium]
MNLLLVNWQDIRNPQAGGAELHLFELFSRLAARGHRVRLVCSGFEGGATPELVDGIEVHRTGGRHSFALLGRRAVRRALRAERPDLVIEDINKLPLGLPTLTELPVYAIIPHLFGTTAFQEAAWPMAATVWTAERLIPMIYRRARFHAISDSTRDDLVARGISADRIDVVCPGVDAVRFTPDPAIGRHDPGRFVYVGRLKRYKGVEHLIRALAIARQTHPELSVDIAGSGDDRPRLEELTRRLGQAGHVRFLGFVDEATKISLLRRAVANVFPSPKEGWGITVMEAAACGTPSLASDAPGLRDSVRDGITGRLVPHADPTALAQAMLDLADDPATVERWGRAARDHAERLSWDAAADALERHLTDFLAGASSPVAAT